MTWSDGVITTNTSSPAIRTVAPTTPTTYAVTGTVDANTCSGTISGSTTVTPIPKAVVSGGKTICPDGLVDIQADLTGTAPWIVTWSDGVITTNTSSPAIRNVSPVSTTIYTVTSVNDSNGVLGIFTGDAVVTIGVAVDAAISAAETVCANSAGNTALVLDAGNGASYDWSITNGTITAGQGTSNITWSAGSGDPIVLGVTVVSGTGCIDSNSLQITTIGTPPSCLITGLDMALPNSTNNVYSGPSGSDLTYGWTISGHGVIAGSASNQSVNVDAGFDGVFALTLVVANTNGCVATCTKSVTGAPGIGWWQFNEGAGTNAFDSSGNGNTGVLEGDPLPIWVGGISSNALLFDGVQNDVSVANAAVLSPTNTITVTAWINVLPSTNGAIVSKWATDDFDGSYALSLSQGQLVFGLFLNGASVSVTGTTSVTDTNWHHAVAAYDGAQARIYLDGNVIGSAVVTGAIDIVSAPLLIGNDANGSGFPGRLMDVRLYNRPLGADEITSLLNADTDGNGLSDWWEMKYFGHLGVDPNAATPVSGMNVRTAYLLGLDPTSGAASDTNRQLRLIIFTPLERRCP